LDTQVPRIAISYRRADSQEITGRIFDRLAARYGKESVFWDFADHAPISVDFREYINNMIAQTDITLVVVGKGWLGEQRGPRRHIDNPGDSVRIEVEAALRSGKPLVPVLVEGAGMPGADELPDSLEEFVYFNGQDVDAGPDFDQHIQRLILGIERVLAEPKPAPQMPRIVICYRREDSAAITGRIFDRLVAHYGKDSVFRDICSRIPLGVSFREYINTVIAHADITLVVVGKRWLGQRGGRRRIDNPGDPIRIEVEVALRGGKPVVPILVEGAGMPDANELPDSLRELVYRNGQAIDSGRDFDQHIQRLIVSMKPVLAAAGGVRQAEEKRQRAAAEFQPVFWGRMAAQQAEQEPRRREAGSREPDGTRRNTAEMSGSALQRERTLAVVLGVSEWPSYPEFTSATSFRRSAQEVADYLCSPEGPNIPKANIRVQIDAFEDAPEILRGVRRFIRDRRKYLKNYGTTATDLFIYYVGHGGFGERDTFFLSVRATDEDDPLGTSITAESLGRLIQEDAAGLRTYLVLDCCFAASVMRVFMSGGGPLGVAEVKLQDALPPQGDLRGETGALPEYGTALFCASGPREPARAPPNLPHTMFTGGLLEVLHEGDAEAPLWLSSDDLQRVVRARLAERFKDKAVLPQVHVPQQRRGRVDLVPLFRNPARGAQG
jgi:hypothetical protein